jgi:hypothetical protein
MVKIDAVRPQKMTVYRLFWKPANCYNRVKPFTVLDPAL